MGADTKALIWKKGPAGLIVCRYVRHSGKTCFGDEEIRCV